MLNHLVMFRRKTDVVANAGLETSLIERMDTLNAQITGILNDCLFHPLQQALMADLKPYFACFEWAAVDYTL
ncbi:MAG: hypothetical protein Q8R06_19960 [Polaromonas sp.]|uniref:hypothetical protein n=1 Tax=Polaromonas sp. TaxID=1869339 RepID=UPI002734DF48|nr:hypothetical protein [Polaromonas sp.]MDP3799386.1 hypothetical protein [Polaromonas sp.]